MADYRLYHLKKGRIFGCDMFAASDDAEAETESRRRTRGDPSELWCRSRKVAAFDASGALVRSEP